MTTHAWTTADGDASLPGHLADAAPPRDMSDRAVLELMYRRHYTMIAAYLYRRTADTHAAEDLAAETFLSAMRSIRRMRARNIPPRLWLLRIATNAAHRRGRARREHRGARPETATPPPGWSHEQLAVREAVQSLPDRFASVISLHYFAGLSILEISAALASREGTVKSRLARGRDLLKRHLAHQLTTDPDRSPRQPGGGQ